MFPMQGAWVQSLVRELGFHMPHSTAEEIKRKKKGAEVMVEHGRIGDW